MRKILTVSAMALVMMLMPAQADAQGLLGRALEKAGSKVSGAISDRIGEKIGEKIGDKVKDKMPEGMKSAMDAAESMEDLDASSISLTGGKEALQPKRSSTFGWDGPVTLSTAKFPVPLMKEFPALPTAAQLVNPNEEEQIAFYRAIKAVTLRAEELNSDETCADAETELWRKEYEKALKDAYGFTDEDIRKIESGNLSEAEQEALQTKIISAMFGGKSVEDLEKQLSGAQTMTTDDAINGMLASQFAVYDKHAADLKKYTGITAGETKEYAKLAFSDEKAAEKMQKEMKAKTDAYVKEQSAKDPNFEKEAKAFSKAMEKELMDAMRSQSPLGSISMAMADVESKMAPLREKQMKQMAYYSNLAKMFPESSFDAAADAKFAASEKKKLEDIKARIYATDDQNVYDPLYQQALEAIRTYRERAAKVWLADVQKRYDAVNGSMSDFVQVQRQAVEDGIIPECALWRVPLNAVIYAGDILAEAYSEFPCDYPPMYNEEVVRQVRLASNESAWWPEFYVVSSLENILAGKNIFKAVETGNGVQIYQFNAGSWSVVPDNFNQKAVAGESKPQSATWTSKDGKRKASFNAEGGFIQLPEGDVIYPDAWEKQGNNLVWAIIKTVDQTDGSRLYQIVKCTYKL